MNIATGWILPCFQERRLDVLAPGAAAVLVTASCVSYAVVGVAVPRLWLYDRNCGRSDTLP
jgi:hypothetical protein